MNRMLICVVGLFLPLPLSGCQAVTPEELIQCFNDDDCPPTCFCDIEIPSYCRAGNDTCAGTCNRETICDPGTECMREPGTVAPAFFSCQPVQGAGGAGGAGGTGGSGSALPSSTPRVGVDVGNDTTNSLLKLIGIENGSVTDIGELFSSMDPSAEPKIRQLAYDWRSDVLYGVNVGLNQAHQLFTIDVCTGAATKVGDLLRPDSMPFVLLEAVAVDPDGVIYVSGSLDDQVYSKTLLRVLTDGGVTTEAVGDFGQTQNGIVDMENVGDADRMFFVDTQLYITDTIRENEDAIFRTYVYAIDVEQPGNSSSPESLLNSPFELSSIAWDNMSATESVSWVSTPDMRPAEGWYVIDLDPPRGTSKIQAPPNGPANFDGPFAFVNREGCER